MDVESKPVRPCAERVARRAIALAAVGNRGLVENELGSVEMPEERLLATIECVIESGVADELEAAEWDILRAPLGELDEQLMIDSVWRLEGLGVLLWALQRYELPPYDELVTPADLFELVGFFDTEVALEFISGARLRPYEELDAYCNHATMANWRFRNFRLRPTPVDFVGMSRGCWIGTFDITRFRILNNDVMLRDEEISEADRELVGLCESIANERHLAINWLDGESKIYSETDTST